MALRGFNLLRMQLTPPTAWDKIYQWMVGTARVIIIVVEIIVVIAFGARVVVDTIAKNLDEKIERRDAELAAFRSTELEYRNIQQKTALYRELWTQSSDLAFYFDYINNLVRNYIGLITISLSNEEVNISGELPLSDVGILEEKMKADKLGSSPNPIFTDVQLIDVDSEGKTESELATFSLVGWFISRDTTRELNTIQ